MIFISLIFNTCVLIRSHKNPNCEYHLVEIRDECPKVSTIDWEAYGEQLYTSKSLVFFGAPNESIEHMHQLLNRITGEKFYVGFECPQAALASFFSLAEKLANSRRLRRAQAAIFMGFVFARDKGFYDCSPWPVHGWDMLLAGRFLSQSIRSLDDLSVTKNIPRNHKYFQPGDVAIVSVCSYSQDEPLVLISRENHKLYAGLHDYVLYQFEDDSELVENLDSGMNMKDRNKFFSKIIAVRNVLNNHKWVLWMDCDAFFMDPARTIDSVVQMYTKNNSLAFRLESSNDQRTLESIRSTLDSIEINLLITVDSTGLNNGVWLMRNSKWSIDFLSRWWNSSILKGMGANHNCSDQTTMQYELLYSNLMSELTTEIGRAWDSIEAPIWPREVRVVPQEHLQSFHKETADAVISRHYTDGDFVKHHPGCHYYKRPCQDRYAEAQSIFLTKLKQ
jgi:hypothetical protein